MPRGKHNNHTRGQSHYRWNHGKIISSHGYVKVRVGKEHPFADPNGYAYEHVLVWVNAGNQPPSPSQIIHHINGNMQDNSIGNLQIMARSEHSTRHNAERGRDALGRFKKRAAMPDGVEYKEYPHE